MECSLVLNASLMEKLEVHVQVGASRVPRELADGGRVSSPVNSDGGDGGDGQDNGDGDVEGYDCGDVDDHDHDGCL